VEAKDRREGEEQMSSGAEERRREMDRERRRWKKIP
jgi:hypothetical protein